MAVHTLVDYLKPQDIGLCQSNSAILQFDEKGKSGDKKIEINQ